MQKAKNIFAILAVALTAGGVTWWQYAETQRLRRELTALRPQEQQLARAAAEHDRLLAAAIAPDRLAALRADRVELLRLRNEAPVLGKPVEPLAAAAGAGKSAGAQAPLLVTGCRNVGRGTPLAAVETMLWAAAGGDIDQLAAALGFEANQGQMIDAEFRRLPPAAQKEYSTPERLAAYFTAHAVPLGSLEPFEQRESDADKATVRVILKAPDGSVKGTFLSLRRAEDGWRLQVPPPVFREYVRIVLESIERPAGAAQAPVMPAR